MKKFNYFTESYETVRRTLRELFVYGCYDSSIGAERQKISGRKYSDELKRIRYFWSKQISARRHGEKKINFFPFNRYPDGENYLLRSYQIHTFRPQDLNLYIFLLQILSNGNIWSVTELIDEVLFRFYFKNEDSGIFYPMMNRKLEEMTAAGLLIRQGKSKYKLAEDIFKDFDSRELLHLYRILFLYRDFLPLPSLGYQVQQVVKDYLRLTRGEEDLPKSCFWFEDIFYQNVLNDEIIYKLLIAFERRQQVTFILPNRLVTNVIPRQIICDCQYGRQYLRGEVEGNTFFWRLDNISNIRLLEKKFPENLPEENVCRYIWNASLHKISEMPCLVEIDFKISDTEFHLLKRLEAEKRFGEIEIINKNHYLFFIKLINPNEIIPWIRSFGYAASVRESSQHNLREKLNEDWAALLKNYLNPVKFFAQSSTIYPPTPKFFPNDLPATNVKQPEFFSEFRNAFYRAVTYAYNKILIDGEQFDTKKLATYLGKISFNFEEKISLHDSLIQEIISCGEDIKKFVLFKEDDSKNFLIPTYTGESLEEIPTLPVRFLEIEKRWLRTLSEAPLAESLFGKKLSKKLRDALKDVSPFQFEKFLTDNGQRTDGDNFDNPQLAKRILLLISAIEQKIFLKYTQIANNGKEYSGVCLPIKIIYSPYLKKFQVRVAVQENNLIALKLINVSRFIRLEKAESVEVFSDEIFEEPEPQNFLKLIVFPIHGFNDIERCFLLFSTNRKEGYFDLKNNVYHLKIYYRNFEQRTLRRKILSLGKAVIIEEPKSLRESLEAELKTILQHT